MDLTPGVDFDSMTGEALKSALAVVVLWTPTSVASRWVRGEARVGADRGVLIPVRFENAELPIDVRAIQTTDLDDWSGDPESDAFKKLESSLTALLSGATQAGALPAAAAAKNAPSPRPSPSALLLAVLAFENLSGDPEMDYFSDGISQEILDSVARGAGLNVIARASSFALRGPDKAPRRVADALKATHILDGSVRKSGARVRISAELVDCAKSRSVWSDRFDRELSDVFALQDEIAGAVAEALKAVFAPAAHPAGVIAPQAYELYLQSRNAPPSVPKSEQLDLAERAALLAPDMAVAWGWLAHLRVKHAVFERGDAPFGPLREMALEAVRRALALDPRMATPRIALSQLEPFAAYSRREMLVDEALMSAPSDSVALMEKSVILSTVGRFVDSLAATRFAATVDPAMASAHGRCGILQLFMGHWREGQAELDAVRARWPGYGINLAAPGAAHEGNWAKLDEIARHAAQHGVNSSSSIGATSLMFAQALRTGDGGFANLVQAVAESEVSGLGAAGLEKLYALAALGRVDAAFLLAERSSYAAMFEPGTFYMAGGHNIDFLCSLSHNAPMIEDVRFIRLCAKLGLVTYWIDNDRWPDCVDSVPYDFRAEVRRLAGGEA